MIATGEPLIVEDIEAAKVTALTRYTLRAEATQHSWPGKILTRLHTALIEQPAAGDRFVTVAVAVFHPVADGFAGRITSAGHPPALIRRAHGTVEEVPGHGTLLSPMFETERLHLPETSFRLGSGDALLLYTDGITEARIGRGHPMFGEQRLARAPAATTGMSADETLTRLTDAVTAHTRGHAGDDTALMLLRVPPTA